ncbi:MAG: sugar porter family MFS transporter [Candidatus Omnitrophota bacterium]
MSSEENKKERMVKIIAGIAAIGGILFGFDTGVISGALLFIKKEWSLVPFSQELIVSAVLLGAVFGSALSGKITDHFGRRNVIITTGIVFIVGSIATALSHSIGTLIAGRFIIGIAIGIASFCVPLYISEIAPAKVRGALVSLNQLAITIGIVVSYLVDESFSGVDHGWRYMFLTGAVPAVILASGMMFLPKTPRWLMFHGYEDEARKVFEKISTGESLDNNIAQMKKSLSEEKGGGWSELTVPWLRMPLLIGIGIMFFQQITGINTVIYYAPTIFQLAGFKSAASAIGATVGIGVVNVLMTVVAIRIIDRVGRKPLLYFGLAGMAFSLGLLGLAFKMQASGAFLKTVSVGSLILYIASFAISLGPIAWLIISEIYPLRVRGVAMSIATVFNWGVNCLVALTFLTIIHKLGAAATFWLYGFLSLFAWVFCYLYVPETKGRTLEEIEQHWINGKSPRAL